MKNGGAFDMHSYASSRRALLERIHESLNADPRFAAAWLAGSFGRQEQDEFSDLDIWIVVRDEDASELCARSHPAGAGTVEARRSIISAFGEPAIIHEHHANAPGGGSFTSVVYRPSGLTIDWTFVPCSLASREPETDLLFDNVQVPLAERLPQLNPAERIERLAERYAFAWMIAVPAAKAWRRRDGVRFHSILEMMFATCREIECLLEGDEPVYTRRSLAPFCPTGEHQHEALADMVDRLLALGNRVESAGADVPHAPHEALGPWFGL